MPSVGYREKTDKILGPRHGVSSQIKFSDKETCVSERRRRQMGFYFECLKFLLLTFRILLPVIALAELIGAIFVLVHLFPYHGLFHEPVFGPGIGLACLAVAVALSSYFVGKATSVRNQCLLALVAVLLALLSVMHVADVIWALVLRANITPPSSALMESISNNTNVVDWDKLQSKLECCGASGSTDHLVKDAKKFPASCCVPAKKSEGFCTYTYQRGCAQPVAEEVQTALGWAAIDGIATFMTLALVTVLAFYFRRQVRRFEARDEPGESVGLVTT